MSKAIPAFATRARRTYLLGFAAAAAALAIPQAALQGQAHAAAVAVTSTPGGAVPSIGAGAVGGPRRSLGIRYGRLTDRIVTPETEEEAESNEGFERDVYTAELSLDMFGGGMRLQLGRAHTRYRFEQADTVMVASPTGLIAALGYGRQFFVVGNSAIRAGIGTDLSAGFADLVGESALSAHAHLPLTVRAGSGPTQVVMWGAPGTAWGSLRGQSATVNTAAAGLRIEFPSGTAVDITGAQLLGDFDAIWGGSRARLSAGVSHSFGRSQRDHVPQFTPAPRPRYSAVANDSTRAAEAAEHARRPRPRIMPQDSAVAVVAAAPAPEAAPAANAVPSSPPPAAQTAPPANAAPTRQPSASEAAPVPTAAPARQPSATQRAPGGRERSIFYSPHEAAPAPAAAATEAAAPPPAAAATQPASRVASSRGAATARPTNSANKTPTRYTVQAAAVKDRDEAIELRIQLGEAGFPARILEGEDYFRIRVGIFTTRAAAEQFARRVRAKDFEAWVTVAEQQ